MQSINYIMFGNVPYEVPSNLPANMTEALEWQYEDDCKKYEELLREISKVKARIDHYDGKYALVEETSFDKHAYDTAWDEMQRIAPICLESEIIDSGYDEF